MFTIYLSWWRNQVENFRVPTTSAKVKVVTVGRAFGVWNNKDSAFQFKLPSEICTADVTFMGTSGFILHLIVQKIYMWLGNI